MTVRKCYCTIFENCQGIVLPLCDCLNGKDRFDASEMSNYALKSKNKILLLLQN